MSVSNIDGIPVMTPNIIRYWQGEIEASIHCMAISTKCPDAERDEEIRVLRHIVKAAKAHWGIE